MITFIRRHLFIEPNKTNINEYQTKNIAYWKQIKLLIALKKQQQKRNEIEKPSED